MMDFWTRNNCNFLAEGRLISRIVACYPIETACPTCGWNPITQAGLKSDCKTCEGKGKLTAWQKYQLHARVTWAAMFQFSFIAPTPGIEQGDCVLTISKDDKSVIDKVMVAERAYLIVDDKTLRPTSFSILNAPKVGEEYQVVCNTFSVT